MTQDHHIYQLRRGISVGRVKAQTIGETLEAINDKHGKLTARIVVDESRQKDAPLHPCFEWNNAKAGELFREQQARFLIRSVQVISPDSVPSPVFVYVPDDNDPAYHDISLVVSQPDMYARALAELVRVMNQAHAAVEKLKAAAADTDDDRRLKLGIAVQALQTAHAAVRNLQ